MSEPARDIVKGLIEVLLDETARIDERDDAGMDLGKYSDARAIEPLISVILDLKNEDWFVESCASSLAEIWCALGYWDKDVVLKMRSEARSEIMGIFRANRPAWHEELTRTL